MEGGKEGWKEGEKGVNTRCERRSMSNNTVMIMTREGGREGARQRSVCVSL